jgi:hypothetical protein
VWVGATPSLHSFVCGCATFNQSAVSGSKLYRYILAFKTRFYSLLQVIYRVLLCFALILTSKPAKLSPKTITVMKFTNRFAMFQAVVADT